MLVTGDDGTPEVNDREAVILHAAHERHLWKSKQKIFSTFSFKVRILNRKVGSTDLPEFELPLGLRNWTEKTSKS